MPLGDSHDHARAAPLRTVLADSARAIAHSRELELRVAAIAERVATAEERAVQIVEAALDALDASVGVAVRRRVGGQVVDLIGAAHLPEDLTNRFRTMSLDAPRPLAEVVRTGRPLYCESREQLLARYPETQDVIERLAIHAVAAVPIRYLGELEGAVAFGFHTPRRFSPGDKAVLRALGSRYARALRDARLYFAEHDARRAEAAARHVAEEARIVAEAAARAQGDFVAVVSHELRTPLQAILGYAELLADGVTGELTPQQQEFSRRIAIGSLSLLQIVENLIGFSAEQIGRQRTDVETFDLRPLVAEVITLAEPLAARKGIALRTEVPALEMRSDPRRIRQILTNLIGNAIKFTDHGDVLVSAAVDAPMSPGGASPAETDVRIVVRDTGAGIAADDLPRLFEPFWQGPRTGSARSGGTGLGLSIVRQLARLLGGDVHVESTPGAGSTFTVRLPLLAPTVAPSVAPPP